MIEFIAFLLSMILLGLLIINNVMLRIKNANITRELTQESLDKLAILEKLSNELNKQDNKSLEQTDGFIKFLSQSRDWAFEYIEDAQAKIATFGIDLNDILTFGKNKKEISKQILEAYKPLQELLPDEQGEK